tara:strand:+ start:3691 stop:4368 length:678 start_codon:yes stop_codon:yes gene_type:complete
MNQSPDTIDTTLSEIKVFLDENNISLDEVTIVGATKNQSIRKIKRALDAGIKDFGENFLQEASEKINALPNCNWHFIGSIQSNKCKQISSMFDWVHTIERIKVAKKLNQHRPSNLDKLNVCIQINLDEEESKSGIKIGEAEGFISNMMEFDNLRVRGLMTIPKLNTEEKAQIEGFKKMKKNFYDLKQKFPSLDTLSMGMSNDYKSAILCGSNMVRIGTKMFGKRT